MTTYAETFRGTQETQIPTIQLLAPNTLPVSEDVVSEVKRAIITTLTEFGIDLSIYQQGLAPSDLVDMTPDKTELRSYSRLPDADRDALVAVISTVPVFDEGREIIAYKTPDNVLFLNLRRVDNAFTDARGIPQAIKAGIVITEEAVHYVQHTLLGEEINGTAHTQDNIAEHIKHSIEEKAAPLKKRIYRKLYPNLEIKVKGVDF